MSPWMEMLMLVCASLAALAFGVLAAHALCRAGFSMIAVHARSVAKVRAATVKPALGTETATA